jgi:Tfp pilus assembly protein PilF
MVRTPVSRQNVLMNFVYLFIGHSRFLLIWISNTHQTLNSPDSAVRFSSSGGVNFLAGHTHTIINPMTRSSITLLAALAIIVCIIFLLNPAVVPVEIGQTSAAALESAPEQPYRAMMLYRKLWDYQPYNRQVFERIGLSASQAGDDETAASMLNGALQRGVIGNEGRVELARIQIGAKEYELASQTLAQIDPGSEYAERADDLMLEIYQAQGDWDSARKLLEHRPGGLDDHLALIFTLFKTPGSVQIPADLAENDPMRAVLDGFTGYAELNSTSRAGAWLMAGSYLQDRQYLALALEAFLRAEKEAPDSGLPLISQAVVLQMSGQDGRDLLQRAVNIDPQNAQVNNLAGIYWYNAGSPEIALVYLEKAKQLAPTPDTLELLAAVEMALGNIDASIADYTSAAEGRGEDPAGWVTLARVCLEQNLYLRERGLDAVRKAIIIDPQNPEIHDLAGQIYWELGDDLTGKKYFEQALQLQADYPPALLHLGIWLNKHGDYGKGAALIQQAADQTIDPGISSQAGQVLEGGKTP